MSMIESEYKSYRHDGIVIKSSVRTSDDEYMIVAHDFLQKLFREFARLCMQCYRPDMNAAYMPYYFSERRLDTAILPALSKICDGVVLTELPVVREESGEVVGSGHGRLDYWCIYRGYTFVIEMKGTRAQVDGCVREHSVKQRWGTMIKQLENVKAECHYNEETTKGVIRLGLHFISAFSPEPMCDSDVRAYRRDIKNTLNTFCQEITKKHHKSAYTPTYAAAWLIPDDMVCADGERTYPGVMLLAKVFKDIKHKNHV